MNIYQLIGAVVLALIQEMGKDTTLEQAQNWASVKANAEALRLEGHENDEQPEGSDEEG